jgi:Phage-related minor tail protein
VGGLRAVNSVTGDLSRGLQSMGGRLGAVGNGLTAMGAAGAGAAAAIAGVALVLNQSVAAADKFQQSSFQITQLLETTGNASGKTAAQIEKLAQSLGESTLASTDEVRKAAAQLLTFKNVAGDAFDRTLIAAQDLASIGMGSISSASIQLAKALEDPERGLASLREVGVSFTASQQELIKSLVETGDVAAAQNEILKVLEAQVGGAAAAQAGGLSGATDTLTERWQILLENIGNAGPIQAATAAMRTLGDVVGNINDALFPDANAVRGGLILQISEAERRLSEANFANDPRGRKARKAAEENLANLREELALLDRKA